MNLSIFLGIYYLIVLVVCIQIILNTNTPSKAMAYVLLAINIPVVGLLFYFLVGLNYRKTKLYKRKLQIDSKAFPEVEKQSALISKQNILSRKEQLGHFYSLATFSNNESFSSVNNHVELLINGEAKFAKLKESLLEAEHHIHFEYYIYENDVVGTELAEILIQKAQQGVTVRFIYDDFGSMSIRKDFVERMRQAGVEVFPFYKINFVRLSNRINYRNHRKIVVIDGKVGFVGGINVSDRYINHANSEIFWRDTHLKISGDAVSNLQFVFLTDWNFCAEQDLGYNEQIFPSLVSKANYGKQLTQVIASGPDSDYPSILYTMIQAILLAKKEILLTTPYFIPDKSFVDAIKIAALSGVKVKILVPKKGDSVFVNAASRSNYEEVLKAGAELYFYTKGFIHSKTLLCDEFVSIVGTANLDHRSFDLNFEINAIVYDQELGHEMKEIFENDLKDSKQVSYEQWRKRPFLKRFFERFMRLFSPLM
jgi:cardiolipin synthase